MIRLYYSILLLIIIDIYVQLVNSTAKSRMFTKSGIMHSRMNCYHNSVVESEFFFWYIKRVNRHTLYYGDPGDCES